MKGIAKIIIIVSIILFLLVSSNAVHVIIRANFIFKIVAVLGVLAGIGLLFSDGKKYK